jgi:O-antigen/teichoic acid export membrane protein
MIIRNSLVNIVSVGLSLVLALLTTALLVRSLDQPAFGLLVLVRTIVGNVGLLENLFGAGITRYVAYHNARGEMERRDAFLATGIAVNLIQGALVSAIAIAVSSLFFDRVFAGLPASLVAAGPALMAVFLAVLLVQIVSLALSRALEGVQAFPEVRSGDVLSQLLLYGLLYAVVRHWPGRPLTQVALAYLVSEVVRLALFFVFVRRCGIRIRGWHMDREAFRALFRFGRPLMVAKAFTMLSFRGDALLLGIFTTLSAVATYQAANQIWSATVAALSALTTALMPLLTQRMAQGASLRKVFLPASRYTLTAAMALAIVVSYSRFSVVRYWLSPAYEQSAQLMLLFMIQLVATYHQGVSSIVALGSNEHQPIQRYEAVTTVVSLIVSLSLIRTLGATAVLVAGIVKCSLAAPLYAGLALRILEIGRREYVTYVVSPAWRFGALLTVVAFVLRWSSSRLQDTFMSFALQVSVLLLAAAGLAWTTVVTKPDRDRILRSATW